MAIKKSGGKSARVGSGPSVPQLGARKGPGASGGSKAVKTVRRGILAAGGTRGEARGVVQNLRHGTNLKPRAQVRLTKTQMKAEGLGAKKVQKTLRAEKTIARRAVVRKSERKYGPANPGTKV